MHPHVVSSHVGVVDIGPDLTSSSVARRLLGYGTDGPASPSEVHLEFTEDAAIMSDADGNGVITKHEALDLNGDGKVTKSEKTRLDADGDGTVTTLEIMLPHISGAMSSDTDGDGKLSKHEAFDLNGDGKVSKVEKTILDADRDGAVSPLELWTTLGTANEEIRRGWEPPIAGSWSDESRLADILNRHGVSGSASQALTAELLRWKAGLFPLSQSAGGAGGTTERGSLHMPPRDLLVLKLWATPFDAIDEVILSLVTLVTLVNLGKWFARRCCRQRYAKVVQTARPSQAHLVGEVEESQQPPTASSEHVAHSA
eukprot:scaffold15503_cov114-Isochrysis_galbana.AAC.2